MMVSKTNNKENTIFLFLWTGVSALGWFLVPINALDPTMRSYLEVGNHAVVYTAFGLLLGIVIGAGQSLILKRQSNSTKNWFILTLLGYALAWPMGLMIDTLIPTIAFALQNVSFLPLIEPSRTISFFPFPADIFIGGWVIGCAQWIGLRKILPVRTSRMAVLWVFGVWLSIGLALFAPFPRNTLIYSSIWNEWFNPFFALERIKIGLLSGLVTGLLLLLIINVNDPCSGSS